MNGDLLLNYEVTKINLAEISKIESKNMNCREVQQKELVDRYLLHQLTGQEQKDFEDHYFHCQDCAHEVHSMQSIIHQVKKISQQEEAPTIVKEQISVIRTLWNRLSEGLEEFYMRFQLLNRPLAVGLTVIILIFVLGSLKLLDLRERLYQLEQPRVNTVYFSLFPAGAQKVIAEELNTINIPPHSPDITLEFSIDATEKYDNFTVNILNQKNEIVWQGTNLKPMGAYETFSLVTSKNFFHPGDYVLIVFGRSKQKIIEIQKFPFRIVFE